MEDYIKDFWESNAEKFKCDSEASWGDNFLLKLEHNIISKYIVDGMTVLDAGCANGFATIKHAEKNKNSNIVGIDFSPKMIYYANENKTKNNASNIEFEVGNITDIEYKENTFDIVYTTRALINLPTWDKQKQGILECLTVTKKYGKLIILEGFSL